MSFVSSEVWDFSSGLVLRGPITRVSHGASMCCSRFVPAVSKARLEVGKNSTKE